jgi:DNA-binding beta-propeller fold protein YncE
MRVVACSLALLALCACGGERAPASGTPRAPAGPGSGVAAPTGIALGYPTRVAGDRHGQIAVTDARAGTVHLLGPSLTAVSTISGLGGPLGVAFRADGAICAGSAIRRTVRCFPAHGPPLELGAGALSLPNDLAFDRGGDLFVADSAADRVQVLDPRGALVRTIGTDPAPAGLAFPAALAIAYPPAHPEGELYVADQRHGRVAVFDLQGRFRRALGAPGAAFDTTWQGRFVRLQALAVDDLGRVHALDALQSRVQVLDGETGAFLETYGEPGTASGQLSLPLGLAILRDGRVLATSAGTGRLEVLRADASTPAGTP